MSTRDRARSGDRGQAAVLLIGALTVAVAFAGVAVDGARLFTARRDLSAVADAAALAGASALDEGAYRASLGREIHVDPQLARAAVATVIADAALPQGARVDVAVGADTVDVRIARPVATTFLRIVGLAEEHIGAHARAAPRRTT
ncbi:MAG: hypothetical protein JOZ99_07950 [Actinobacteria bacterium]|nr:hypothetical protein [Actinomycetota bacterium]